VQLDISNWNVILITVLYVGELGLTWNIVCQHTSGGVTKKTNFLF